VNALRPTKVSLFFKAPRSRSFNDADSRSRELAIESLFSDSRKIRNHLLSNVKHGSEWREIRKSFERSLMAFLKRESDFKNLSKQPLICLKRKGGRKNNYDFVGTFVDKFGSISELKIEFKSGTSIYKQPQFLSVYAKDGVIVSDKCVPYYKFFYDGYILAVARLKKLEKPSFDLYCKYIFTTRYSSEVFFQTFYRMSKSSLSGKRQLKGIADKSIDKYLGYIENQEASINFAAIKTRLKEQREKVFVSWDWRTRSFIFERFSKADVSILSAYTVKKNSNGLRNAICIQTRSGRTISALLRWKNHPCVLGPGWQISMR